MEETVAVVSLLPPAEMTGEDSPLRARYHMITCRQGRDSNVERLYVGEVADAAFVTPFGEAPRRI